MCGLIPPDEGTPDSQAQRELFQAWVGSKRQTWNIHCMPDRARVWRKSLSLPHDVWGDTETWRSKKEAPSYSQPFCKYLESILVDPNHHHFINATMKVIISSTNVNSVNRVKYLLRVIKHQSCLDWKPSYLNHLRQTWVSSKWTLEIKARDNISSPATYSTYVSHLIRHLRGWEHVGVCMYYLTNLFPWRRKTSGAVIVMGELSAVESAWLRAGG